MYEVDLDILVDVQEVFDNLSTKDQVNFLKENLALLDENDLMEVCKGVGII